MPADVPKIPKDSSEDSSEKIPWNRHSYQQPHNNHTGIPLYNIAFLSGYLHFVRLSLDCTKFLDPKPGQIEFKHFLCPPISPSEFLLCHLRESNA